jgi:hypothetical protein
MCSFFRGMANPLIIEPRISSSSAIPLCLFRCREEQRERQRERDGGKEGKDRLDVCLVDCDDAGAGAECRSRMQKQM